MTSAPRGWHWDPRTPGGVRWWNGSAWTAAAWRTPPAHDLASDPEAASPEALEVLPPASSLPADWAPPPTGTPVVASWTGIRSPGGALIVARDRREGDRRTRMILGGVVGVFAALALIRPVTQLAYDPSAVVFMIVVLALLVALLAFPRTRPFGLGAAISVFATWIVAIGPCLTLFGAFS